jgi:RNA polymerase sigma-70 factor (ECF subfamily)
MSFFRLTSGGDPPTEEEMAFARQSPEARAREMTALVARARAGELAAIQQVFTAHLPGVHRLVYRMVGPSPDLDDLVQTVFVEAFRSLPGFRGDALFSTWLSRIAVRVTMHAVRRRPPPALSIHGGEDIPVDLPSAERRVAAREALAVLDRLLAEMRPKRRAAFVLHVLEGHPMEEVAAILNASTAAVKVRVHDARRHIERRLERDPALAESLMPGGRS